MTVRLSQVALTYWADLDGLAVSRNMPPLQSLPVDRFCNFVWWWMTRNADEAERKRLQARIWQPPLDYVPKTGPWAAQNESSSFQSLKAALTQAPAPAGGA